MRRRQRRIVKGTAAGLIGGLVGSWTMNQFQSLLSKSSDDHSIQNQDCRTERQQECHEPATLKLAKKISEGVLHHQLTDKQKKIAEPVVDYTYAAVWGGIYGALAEVSRKTSTAVGLPFGAALWLAGDEIAVPALGLSKPPTEYPVSTHLQALAAHEVYGMTTELVRRAILKVIA